MTIYLKYFLLCLLMLLPLEALSKEADPIVIVAAILIGPLIIVSALIWLIVLMVNKFK